MTKRGISALIAVVLILGFSVAVGAIVLTWGGGFIKNLQESTERSAEKQMTCSSDVRLDIRKIKFLGNKIELLIENVGKKDIEKFHLRIYGSDGVDSIEVNSSLSSFGISNYEVEFDPGKTGFVESVGVFPSIIYGNEIISCSNIKAGEEFGLGVPTGAVLYINFDDGSAKDLSGNGNDGTLKNFDNTSISGPTTDGRVGSAFKFDGVDDWVSISDDESLDFGVDDFAISAWVKTTYGGTQRIVHKVSGIDQGYSFLLNSNINFYIANESGEVGITVESINNVFDDNWHHIVVSADRDGDATFYIDGVLDSSSDISGEAGSISNNEPISIGYNPDSGGIQHFNGTIDEVKIWNISLSEGEIKSIYYQR